MPDRGDWRLQGQERFLRGLAWTRLPYRRYREGWEHDHCEMCSAKFAEAEVPDALRDGYSTDDCYHWVCLTCFEDFREAFGWRLAERPAEV